MGTEKRQQIIDKAMEVFQKHGYRRVNMKEIAESLNISRPGLYLYFKTKEDVFNAVIKHFSSAAIQRVQNKAKEKKTLKAKLLAAFDIYVVEIFEMTLESAEAREIADSSFEFARETLEEGYRNFERVLTTILKENHSELKRKTSLSLEAYSHLLVSSVRGFKLVANSAAELRKLIQQLIEATLPLG